MDAAKGRNLAVQQPENKDKSVTLKNLSRDLNRHVISFLVGNSAAKFKPNSKPPEIYPAGSFLFNHQASYAIHIAHNLLWQIDVEETLKLAAQYPESLLMTVEIKDPYGQRVRGTPLQIVKAAGDRNTREMKAEEKPYGLVERLLPCFKNPNDYYNQLKAWDKDSKAATEKTMAPYKKAIEILCQDIIASKDISDAVPFEELLKLPMVEEFRKALIPDPNHVVTSGSLFDMQIFLDFFAIWEANVNNDKVEDKKRANLDGWYSLKSDLFAAIVYPALQARCERCDYAIFKIGIGKVSDGQIPDRLDFSKGVPADLVGFGSSHFFGFYGDAAALRRARLTHPEGCSARYRKLCQAKTSPIGIMQPQQNHTTNCVIL